MFHINRCNIVNSRHASMKENSEIRALLQLLDDPDEVVYKEVSEKIKDYGKRIIPNLEDFWQQTQDSQVQFRIEHIIHEVNLDDVLQQFTSWFANNKNDLFNGALLLASYLFPTFDEMQAHRTLKSIYQSCWLEINQYLTPLEQINTINSIVYSMYKFKGHDLEENKPAHYFINEVLETRLGNNYSLGLLYQVLCEKLDIPVFAIQLPRQFLLAYFTTENDLHSPDQPQLKIQFYIDPNNGSIYTQNDVDHYLKKYDLEIDEYTYLPLHHHDIIQFTIEALIQTYDMINEDDKSADLKKILMCRQFI